MENIIIQRKNQRGSSALALPEKTEEAAALLPALSRRTKTILPHPCNSETHRDETKGTSK